MQLCGLITAYLQRDNKRCTHTMRLPFKRPSSHCSHKAKALLAIQFVHPLDSLQAVYPVADFCKTCYSCFISKFWVCVSDVCLLWCREADALLAGRL